MRTRAIFCAMVGALCGAASAQVPTAGPVATQGRPGGNRVAVGPVESDLYRSRFVALGDGVRDGLLYEPKGRASQPVAILYSNGNFGFDPPAAELAARGYRVLYVAQPPLAPGAMAMPTDGFREVSQGIRFLRTLPGVERVVVQGWGSGAAPATLYTAVAAHGADACRGKAVLYPCDAKAVAGLARPDGLILLDPGLGAGTKVANVVPAPDGPGLDRLAAANGYDADTRTARYPPAFRRRYFAAQAARNRALVDAAVATAASQGDKAAAPAGANPAAGASLSATDLTLLSHTKRPHLLLRADGSRVQAILRSTRPAPVAGVPMGGPPRAGYSVAEYLANDAIRTTDAYALTEDDVVGVDWASSNFGTPAQAEQVAVPTLIMSNGCFQFVVPAEIILDHLAARDRTQVAVEGSEHEFGPCAPRFGDTKARLFDYVAEWLGKPGRFR